MQASTASQLNDYVFYYSFSSSVVLLSLASVYQLLLLYDTLACRNTIQLIGLCVYTALLCIYAGLQIQQVEVANYYSNRNYDIEIPHMKPLAISSAAIIGAFTAIICAVSWKVYGEFRWTVFQRFNADSKMQRRYFTFQVRTPKSAHLPVIRSEVSDCFGP